MPVDRLTQSAAPRPGVGIVHLGLGAFYRAFGAIYVAEAMAASGGDWGIVGVSLKNPRTRDALAPQNWAYTSVTLAENDESTKVIDVLENVLVAPENPAAVLEAMADSGVRIVSLTVTEKGYCHNPITGALTVDHPDIAHDLQQEMPRSAPGFLVRQIVLDFAHLIDPTLAQWIGENGRFPATMVDRITPATTSADIARVTAVTGLYDSAPVLHEPFRQWVIEDNFVRDMRPDFNAVGVEMVKDVSRFEQMKLRMLNGSHSALAYLGYLAGHETISDTVADPAFAAYVRQLWAEVMPVVRAPKGFDLQVYAQALMERYANSKIRHRTWQIAMDGSQKLPQRLLGSLEANIAAGKPVPGLCLAVAAWMYYVGGIDQTGQPIDVKDPMAEKLRAISDASTTPADKVAALLSLSEIFPIELAENLKAPVTEAAQILWTQGARQAALQVVT